MGSGVFEDDIMRVVTDEAIPWREMEGATVFVTGVTGLVGSALVRVLNTANDVRGLGLTIIGCSRNIEDSKMLLQDHIIDAFIEWDVRGAFTTDNVSVDTLSVETPMLGTSNTTTPMEDESVADEIAMVTPTAVKLPQRLDYIFHCAAITQSSEMVARPVDVIAAAVDGTRNVLELAKEKQCRSFVYLSSMEVYGQTELTEVRESDLGFVDLSLPRTCYPESKRMCENLCSAYLAQFGIPVKNARLALTFGAGMSKIDGDSRVFMQFARKAIVGEDIELHTAGDSIINCCYITDTIAGLLIVLLNGENGEAYNIANPEASMAVRDMAAVVADKACGGRIGVITKIPDDIGKRGYAPDCGHIINIDKLRSLGWMPRYGLTEMFTRMMTYMGELKLAEGIAEENTGDA